MAATIYDRPVRFLMQEFAKEKLVPGQVFSKHDAEVWFQQHYSKIKPVTVGMHVEGMSVNSVLRKHHPHIRSGLGWDLFFKLPNGRFRLWDTGADPAPVYKADLINNEIEKDTARETIEADESDAQLSEGGSEFAYERHLRDYLAKNLSVIEVGLKLYEEEDFNGIEFPVGGRFIDLLAIDSKGDFVVIELKVSRGYDKTIGQILRYMGWIQKNLAGEKAVRGIIVASEITDDLRLATSRIRDVKLMEYELSFKLKPVAQL